MQSKTTKQIIKRLSEQHFIPEAEIYKVVHFMFGKVKETIINSDGENVMFKNIRIMGLGKFYVPYKKKKFLIAKKANIKRKEFYTNAILKED